MATYSHSQKDWRENKEVFKKKVQRTVRKSQENM